jgi:DNA-binding LacI/PurR family transcriptional regulator
MAQAYTSRDVARLAGVSQSTVSYVMTGRRPISEETRKRVSAAIEQLTYERHAGARALASQRSRVVGLFMPFGDGNDTVGKLPFIENIAASARAHDHELLLVTADEGSAGLRRLAGRSLCDAMIIMDIELDDERVAVAAELPVPVILIGVPRDPRGLHCVDLDFVQAAQIAIDELSATGHDRIALLGHPADLTRRRLNYVSRFIDAAREHADLLGIRLEVIAPVELGRAAAAAAVDQAVAFGGGGRLGLLVPESGNVQAVLHALHSRGSLPGRDVSVVAVCTDAMAQDSEPPVTNVSLERRDVSQRAMETLFWLLEPDQRKPPPGIALVPARLTSRQTVMPPP